MLDRFRYILVLFDVFSFCLLLINASMVSSFVSSKAGKIFVPIFIMFLGICAVSFLNVLLFNLADIVLK